LPVLAFCVDCKDFVDGGYFSVALNLSSFETALMKTEFDRLSARQPMDTLSMKRYELPTPPPGKMTDIQVRECRFVDSDPYTHWIRILNPNLGSGSRGKFVHFYN
jgi:hypothetical protein